MNKRQFILEIETNDKEYTFDDLFENVSQAIINMIYPSGCHIEIIEAES